LTFPRPKPTRPELSPAADMFRASDSPDDTEVVIGMLAGAPAALVRVPARDHMVALGQADCAVFEVSFGPTSYTMNDEVGLSGHVKLDCRRPELGHVTGEAEFTCF
jgi:hypothetical protein